MKVYGFVGQPSGNNKGPDALLLRTLNGRPTVNDLKLLLPSGKNDEADSLSPVASYLCTKVLGMLVDKWIDSGKTEAGEEPYKRKCPPSEFFDDYLDRNRPMLRFTTEGPSLLLDPRTFRDWKEPGPLAKDYLGTLLSELQDPEPSFTRDLRRVMPYACDMAIALFLQMLDSSITAKLFRCDGCGDYFARRRAAKKDTPIFRGSWCASCKRDGRDRVQRTKESRDHRTKQRIEWAADVWPQWKPDRRHGERAEWIARQVSKRLDGDAIAKNWVTHHTKEIEAEVERRKHAKG
jgi:hypothetical protein